MKRATRLERPAEALLAQEQLLPFLLNPASYPHRPRRVRLVQTHSSFVFIAPPLVFKVKKPVNFGFLDFSTLERRRYYCEREVELNRRLCPEIYLGVVPICRSGTRFTLGEGEEVLEYAVQMRQLSDGHFLDQLVRKNRVSRSDLDRVIKTLKSFYEAQRPTPEVESWGRIQRLRISTDENFRQTTEFVGRTLSSPAFEALRHYTNRFYARNGPLFASRVRENRIRDCHGDLHLEHIHVTSRGLHIFDCIEFNDRLRYVDVASDAAFLAMDLDFQGRSDLARLFERHLALALKDEGLPRLMDFYKCYRAYVRGKVESLHSVAHAAPEAERETSRERASRYFQLALNYAASGSQPLVLAVMGRIASGKSTLSRALGAELGWPVISSDRVRKEMAGFPLFERSSAAARRRLYSTAMTQATYERLFDLAATEIRAGRGVILDATFAQPAHRAALRRHFKALGVRNLFMETSARDAVVRRRLKIREARADEISDARLEDFDLLTRLYQPPAEEPAVELIQVRTTGALDRTTTAALKRLVDVRLAARPYLQ